MQIKADPNPPKAHADHAEITQVLIDRIRNRLESMEDIPADECRMLVELQNERAGWLRVSITDCDCGVPAEQQSKGFRAFVTTKPDGLGLGLSLCKTIIESRSGRLRYKPASPTGSKLSFLLPSEERVFEAAISALFPLEL